jgi:hypothetical protein
LKVGVGFNEEVRASTITGVGDGSSSEESSTESIITVRAQPPNALLGVIAFPGRRPPPKSTWLRTDIVRKLQNYQKSRSQLEGGLTVLNHRVKRKFRATNNALLPLPPTEEFETVPVVKAVTGASRALAELKVGPRNGFDRNSGTLGRSDQYGGESFCNNAADGLDPLVKMAVLHYQFEAIHPFSLLGDQVRYGRRHCRTFY